MKKSKKLLALLLTLLMVVSVFPTSVFAVEAEEKLVIEAESVTGKAGDTVDVAIKVTENPGIIAFGIQVKYDSSKLEIVEEYDAENEVHLNPAVSKIFGTAFNYTTSENYNDNPYTLVVDNVGSKNNTATGTLMELTFRIKAGAELGDTPIELSYTKSGTPIDKNLDTVPHEVKNGKVTVSDHSWGTPVYNWSSDKSTCTATVSCTCCAGNAKTETVSSTNVHTPADCENAEDTVYTAAFTKSPFTTQTETVTGQAKLGHQWGAAAYDWSSDHTACTASHTCTRGTCGETETEAAQASVTTNAPSCYAEGTKTYTATFTKAGFSAQTYSETLGVVGHSWSAPSYDWSDDHSTCTAERHCTAAGCTASETETATAAVQTDAATCTEGGSTVYTAAFESTNFETQTHTATQAKLGHDWGSVTYTWAAGYGACTAERSCKRTDCGEKEAETKASACVTVEPTEDENGSNTYTVIFENEAFETQTHVEVLYAEPMFIVSTATVHAGQTAEITLEMKNNPGIVAAELEISYDSSVVELVNVEDAGLMGGYEGSETYSNPFYVSWLQNDPNNKNGVLATFTFKAKADCEAGTSSAVSVTVKSATDTDLDPVTFAKNDGSVTVTAHNWSDVTYTWNDDNTSCTAERTCDCGAEESENGTVTAETTEATCTEAGYTVYTATFTNTAFVKQEKTVAGEEKLGHDWSAASYTWSEDNASCTAERSCGRTDCGVTETETVTASKAVTEKTCTEAGYTVYTATFTNEAFETQTKTVDGEPATGHNFVVSGNAEGGIACTCTACGESYSEATGSDDFEMTVDGNTPVFKVSDAEGYVGEEVTVTVELNNNPGIVGAVLDMAYDSSKLQLVKVEDAGLLGGFTGSESSSENPYRLTWLETDTGTNNTANGVVATLTFKLLKSGTGNVEITYVPDNIVNADLDSVAFAIDNAVVTAKTQNSGGSSASRKNYVTFRLIGDSKHDNGVEGHDEYVTWIATTRYEISQGNTVYDVFMKALAEHGLSQKGASGGYVSAIKAPSVLGGYWLSEYDNGPNSGWMYTVNGVHVSDSLKDCVLQNGDSIVWHYTDDYTKEEKISGKYYQRWLEAEDISPEEYVKQNEKEEEQTAAFVDVKKSDWFYDEVQFAVSNGLFNGVGGDKFDPNGSMTRAMLVTVLYRLEGEPAVRGTSPFSDVANNTWYTEAVIWAEDNNIVNGIGDNEFAPTANITREQMATVLYRYAQYKKYDTSASSGLSKYNDVSSISAWALNALKWANAKSLITGRTTTTLAPKGTATRAEVAAILCRFVENVVNK